MPRFHFLNGHRADTDRPAHKPSRRPADVRFQPADYRARGLVLWPVAPICGPRWQLTSLAGLVYRGVCFLAHPCTHATGHFQSFVRSTRKAVFTSETVVVAGGELFTLAYFSIIKLVYSCHHRSLGILKFLPLCGATAPLEATVF